MTGNTMPAASLANDCPGWSVRLVPVVARASYLPRSSVSTTIAKSSSRRASRGEAIATMNTAHLPRVVCVETNAALLACARLRLGLELEPSTYLPGQLRLLHRESLPRFRYCRCSPPEILR